MFGRKKVIVPEWAAGLKTKDYASFISSVENYFKERNEPYSMGDGIVRLGDNSWEFGLGNLVQICAQHTPKDYPVIVANHFGAMVESKTFNEQFKLIAEDFEKAKQYIGVRLYNQQYATVLGEDTFIRRHFAGEVFAALVYDFPHAIVSLPQSDFDKWGKTLDEVFAIGMENIRKNYKLNAEKIAFGENYVFIAETEHLFAPNILFELEQHPELTGKGGAIIGIPTRHCAMIYPIHDMKVIDALTMFFDNIPKFYAQGPGSLTSEIYWYYNGQYETLDYNVDKEVHFTPSAAFLDLLNNGGLE